MKANGNEARGTALITGAGSGIGLALAHEFARHGHPLLLTSRVESEIQATAAQISAQYHVPVGAIGGDLMEAETPARIFEAVQRDKTTIDILVNDAGLGFRGKFTEIPVEDQIAIIRVNIEAVVRLTHLFLPSIQRRNVGGILNVASIAGFEPGPLLAVYHASKAFVLSFTEALHVALKDTNFKISALCPGATDTDFFPKAGMMNTRAFQQSHVMSPQAVAEIGYNGFMRGDPTIVAGGSNKALVFLRRFMTEKKMAQMNKKFYEEVPPQKRKRARGEFEEKAKA
ncbi:MAG: SDR family NAD(P)-dependent oxidoreductase [Limisphaerales bacterium]